MKEENPFVSCKGIRIPECKKFLLVESRIWENLLVESGILGFGIQNTAQGIRNPTNFWIRNQISIDKDWNPVIGVWDPWCGIQNPESRIEDCLGFPNMGQILCAISAVMASMLNKNLGLKTRLSAEPFTWK